MIKGSQTEKNIEIANQMEGKLKLKFAYYAVLALDEKQYKAAKAFSSVSGDVKRTPSILWADLVQETENKEHCHAFENLLDASDMYSQMSKTYLGFAKVARAEKFDSIAENFNEAAMYDLKESKYFKEFAESVREQSEIILN